MTVLLKTLEVCYLMKLDNVIMPEFFRRTGNLRNVLRYVTSLASVVFCLDKWIAPICIQ